MECLLPSLGGLLIEGRGVFQMFEEFPIYSTLYDEAEWRLGTEAHILPRRQRRRFIVTWVNCMMQTRDARLAKEEASKALPIWASILLSIIIRRILKRLEDWWSNR